MEEKNDFQDDETPSPNRKRRRIHSFQMPRSFP